MTVWTRKTCLAIALAFSLLLASCVIEETLQINSDGSGTYRVRVSVPREFGEDFSELRKEAEKTGFLIDQEGETSNERFIVLRKDFTTLAALNDSYSHYELTMTDAGFLRREYRLQVSLKAIGFGSFKRRLVVTMPGEVQSASAGVPAGNRVTWEGSNGVTMEIVAAGFHLPLTRNQNLAAIITVLAGALLFALARRRRQQASICPSCHSARTSDERFCRVCGAGEPVTEA